MMYYEWKGINIGMIPESILSGKAVLPNIRYAISLINDAYRLMHIDLGLVIAKDWEYGNGYKLCCKNKPNFMKDEKYLWGDKAQIFWHLRNKFFYFCIKDIDDFFNKHGVNHELSLIKVKLDMLDNIIDKPDYEFNKEIKKLRRIVK